MARKMNTGKSPVTRIDHDDPLSKAALAAEQRLFGRYGLEYKVHFVEMQDPDLRIRVLETGEGPPLLMVPGGSGEAVFYAPLIAELKGWRILAINRPGGGLSDGIDHRKIDLRQLAVNTLKSVADAFGLERIPIVCNSMGGLWSIWYALEYPGRVTQMVQMGCPALILNTSAPFFMRLLSVPVINRLMVPNMQPKRVDKALDGLRLQGSSREAIARIPKEGAEAAYHFFRLPTYLDTWVTLISAILTIRGSRPRYRLGAEALKNIRQPVLFLWGRNDPFGSLETAREASQIIPDSRLCEMPTGHLPYIDQPQECGRVICEFLLEDGK